MLGENIVEIGGHKKMVLSVNNLKIEKKDIRAVGEVRMDAEQKGYFHTFTKDELEKKYGVEVKAFDKAEAEDDIDLNNDGKVDEKDVTLASKVMRKAKSIKSRSKKAKK